MALIIGGAVLGFGISAAVINYFKNRSRKDETSQHLPEKEETKDTVESLQKEDEDDDGDKDEDYDFEESRKVLNVLNEDIQNIKENLVAEKRKQEQIHQNIRGTQSEITERYKSFKALQEQESVAQDRTLDCANDLRREKGSWFGNKNTLALKEAKLENAKREEENIRKTKDDLNNRLTDLKEKHELMQKDVQEIEKEIKKQENEKKEREKRIENKEREIEMKMREEKSLMDKPFRTLPGESKSLDKNVKIHFLQKIRGLKALSEEFRFVNILLVGPTGAGKSSFVNTSATALAQEGRMIHASNIRTSAAESATKRLCPEILTINGDIDLKARMFDCRGLSLTGQESIGKNEMELIIEGHVEQYSNITDGASMTKTEDVFIPNPQVKNEMHCIVYVVKASTQEEFLNDDIEKEIKGMLDKQTPTNKPQFILLTNMDKVVPRKDVKNLFRYLCVRRACNNASKITQLTPQYILPTANYADQFWPTDDIDALCLLNLFRIVSSAHDYVIRRLVEEKEKNQA